MALDQYDHYQGLWPLRKRNPAAQTRLSTVLHWKTLQGLLGLCKSRTRSQSHRITPPQDKRKVVISQSMKPRDSSSRASTSLQCIDSHCHLDRLFGKLRFRGSLVQFLEQYAETDNLQACITNFCDPEFYATKPEVVSSILHSPLVFAAFGCHPKKVHHFTPRAEHALKRYLSQSRTLLALGEIGLDFDIPTITS